MKEITGVGKKKAKSNLHPREIKIIKLLCNS